MRVLRAAAILVLFAAPSSAGVSSSVVIAFQDHQSVSVVLRQNAELVSVPVAVYSERKDPAERFAEIQKGLQTILDKAAAPTSEIVARQGPVTLSGRRGSSKFSLSSSSYTSPSRAQLNLMMELKGRDVFRCASKIQEFVAGLTPPSEARYEVGDVQLAIDNPEARRQQIIQAVAADVAKTRQLLGDGGKVTISGLEGPVLVRQVSDREVELFIDYVLAFDLK